MLRRLMHESLLSYMIPGCDSILCRCLISVGDKHDARVCVMFRINRTRLLAISVRFRFHKHLGVSTAVRSKWGFSNARSRLANFERRWIARQPRKQQSSSQSGSEAVTRAVGRNGSARASNASGGLWGEATLLHSAHGLTCLLARSLPAR